MTPVTVIGAGLAGCECAWQIARRGIGVKLIEMKPGKKTPAHVSPYPAELVCSNSLRGNDLSSAAGLLKEELRRLGSLIIKCADDNRIAAGGALAVDREEFSKDVTARIDSHPLIKRIMSEASEIPAGETVIATGPLTGGGMEICIEKLFGRVGLLRFYDAAAPIVSFESVDMRKAFYASRYGKGTPDYINCPMTEDEYLRLRDELCGADTAEIRDYEDSGVFEGCLPIEVMAKRGVDTMRFGPLKPVGLKDPLTGRESHAVAQLRRDNALGTVYNMVGFQTRLTFPEQRRVFSVIPALKNAEFMRFGVMHRNTYINSPALLDRYYSLKSAPRISFAGQITGVEGYVESCASGLLVGIEKAAKLLELPAADFPAATATGALALYVSGARTSDFQPMNINFGIIEPLGYPVKRKQNKKEETAKRSLEIIEEILKKEVFRRADNN